MAWKETSPSSNQTERFVTVNSAGGPCRLIQIDGQAATTIGRDRGCGIVVQDEFCSRIHCKVIEVQGDWLLAHLSRTNPTIVNGRKVTSIRLHDGDEIEIGQTRLTFYVVPPTGLLPSSGTAG
jgi:pSer/pThr/pTyr-binding forkhead associated (FHA) protein